MYGALDPLSLSLLFPGPGLTGLLNLIAYMFQGFQRDQGKGDLLGLIAPGANCNGKPNNIKKKKL